MQMKRNKTNSRRAFTLIELVIVMVIMAILAAVAFVRYSGEGQTSLNLAAERIAGDIRYMRSLAVSSGKVHGLRFNQIPGSDNFVSYYLNYRDSPGVYPEYSDPTHINPVNFANDYRGVTGVWIGREPWFITYDLAFDHEGVPHIDFELVEPLNDYFYIRFRKGDATKQIVVTPNTGGVKVEDWTP